MNPDADQGAGAVVEASPAPTGPRGGDPNAPGLPLAQRLQTNDPPARTAHRRRTSATPHPGPMPPGQADPSAPMVRGQDVTAATMARGQIVPDKPDISGGLTDGVAAQARLHRMILDRLASAPVPEDMLIRDLARPAAEVAHSLVTLELDGRVQRHPGGMLSRQD